MANCFRAYTHNDLDGAISLLTLMWAYPDSIINYKSFNNLQISELKSEIEHINNPCPTFILDLALRQEFLPELDAENITFFDHHETSEKFISQFSKSKIIYKNTSSNALLMANYFKGEGHKPRTDAQKLLIALADDFDCYRLKIPESYDLNIIFWSEYRNNFQKFIKDYQEGFKPFTSSQKNAIRFIKQQAEEESKNVNLFQGILNISGKHKKTLAAMADKMTNILVDKIIKDQRPDIFFFINTKSEKVSIRQCNNIDPINVGQFAEKICEGGGHSMAAGGIITPLFMEVCKNLTPILK